MHSVDEDVEPETSTAETEKEHELDASSATQDTDLTGVEQQQNDPAETETEDEEWKVVQPTRRSARVKAGVHAPQRYDDYCFHLSLHKGLKSHGKAAC